ncbi:TonB-dependent receptor [Algibacter sp.]|nr:TonB-dependent receptor [Algibacter sp.]
MKTIFLFLLGFCFVLGINAQQKTITGTVTSEADGGVLPGVNVIVKGTSIGASTDFDGNYSITVSGDKATLSFSYIGYVSKNVTVGSNSTINVALAEDLASLEEVVVVGYGSRKKSDVTGAVSSVTTDELNAFPVLDAAQALQGRAAGVVVQSNNGGEPGAPISIKIRGNTSINASSAPLIVVDGFVGATMPQANDIKSLEVLKDASATAIYGSRGSNGVVLVTTKKGRSGKLSIEFNTTYAVQNTSNKLDLLNADDFADYQQTVNNNVFDTRQAAFEIADASWVASTDPNKGDRPDAPILAIYNQGTANTDWQDLIYRQGSTQNHQISFSGGTDNVNFYASGNYFKQDGIVVNSGFERVTFLSNLDAQITDKLKLGLNLFGSRGVKNGIPTQSTGSVTVGNDDVVALAMRFRPDLGITDANGNNTVTSLRDNLDNPFAVATERINETITDNFRANTYLGYELIEGLDFKTTFGFSSTNATEGLYLPSTLIVTAGEQGGVATQENTKNTTVLSENYLTYTKEVGKGKLTLLGGYSYQKDTGAFFAAGASGFPSNSVGYSNLGAGAVTIIPASTLTESETQSQFGRINYDYDDKYLLTATVRRDGASNFSKNEKYAIFPSAAFGWKISNENFLKDSETLSNLKLRASWGKTGNQAISAYESLARLSAIYSSVNGQQVNAVTPDQPSNPDLKWETSIQTNIGLDFGFLNNRISGSIDYYNIDTEDLIMGNTGLPSYFGFLNDQILANVGEINNKGFEIALNAKIINNENFSWNTDLNWSTNKNEVVTLINGADLFGSAAPSYFSRDNTYVLREGESVGLFWGLNYAGIYEGGALPAGTVGFGSSDSPNQIGDPLFLDIDGNGSITSADQTIIGDPNADYTYGITNNFSYKNWDLNIFVQGSQGGEIFNLNNVQLFNGDSNTTYDYYNASNNGTAPRAGNNSDREISSRFIEDGSYVRLKNVALGYNLPSDIVQKIGLENIRLTLSAQNLLTFTNYSGLDPEVSFFGGSGANNVKRNTAQGHDFGSYPTVKSVNFSLNVKF